jgi:hypothetical protein
MRISIIQVALTAIVLGAGCTPSPQPTALSGPSVVVGATPSTAPRSGVPSPAAADACGGVTAQQGGGAAYLDCLANRRSFRGPH